MDKVEPDVFLPLLRRHITGPLDSMMRSEERRVGKEC